MNDENPTWEMDWDGWIMISENIPHLKEERGFLSANFNIGYTTPSSAAAQYSSFTIFPPSSQLKSCGLYNQKVFPKKVFKTAIFLNFNVIPHKV